MTFKMGWLKDQPDARDIKVTYPLKLPRMPGMVDLRAKAPPIYDQKDLGSCTAQASGFVYEFSEIEENHRSGTPSRLQIYFSARKLQGTINQDSGASIRGVFKGIAKDGYSRDSIWPYVTKNFKKDPGKAVWADAAMHRPEGKSYVSVTQDLMLLKAVLLQANPIAFGFSVPESFMSKATEKTGSMTVPVKGEKIVGGHAVALVGYDDAARAFIVRNSWGTGWGKLGYFTMPYSFVVDPKWCSDFWTVLDAPG